MEISLENINSHNEPYQLFLDGIRSPQTARKYKNALFTFLKLIPSQIYQEYLGKIPKQKTPEELSEFFVELAKREPRTVANIIAAFIKEERKRVERKEISSDTLPNHIKPIKVLLDSNAIAIHWKSLYKLMPRRESISKDRAYTKKELQDMLKITNDIADKVIILMSSSAGFRVEAWDYFTWEDVVFFKNNDETYKGAALRIYRGDPEEYWTFITPEACDALQLYKEKWRSDIGSYPKLTDPLLRSANSPMVRRLNQVGVKRRIERVVTSIGLRQEKLPGKKRFEIQLTHGFRKYFNTMMRRVKVDYLDKEDMMGHKVGLEGHYERYNEEDFERFPEYQKAIPFLTISDEERQRMELEKERQEKSELQRKVDEIELLKEEILQKEQEDKERYQEIMELLKNEYQKGTWKRRKPGLFW